MKLTQGISIYLRILKATRSWRSKKIFNSLYQPEDKKEEIIDYWKTPVGGAPPPEVIPAQAQDDLVGWFPLGLTHALVVRKRRGLRRQI
jgi:hypothetical protein